MLQTYHVDLDYESYLFNKDYYPQSDESLKIIKEFEYVFFLVNKDPCILNHFREYDKNYLKKLRENHFFIPELCLKGNDEKSQPWWGHHHNFTIEQYLNSKLTSAEIAMKNCWGFKNGAIVTNAKDIRSHIEKNLNIKKWIIKKPFSFSGIGHYQFQSDKFNDFLISKMIEGPVLLEPLLDRKFDIGTTFIVENGKILKQFMVLNYNNKSGGFRGGIGASSVDKFKKYMLDFLNYDIDPLVIQTQAIAQHYLDLGAQKNIQIDSFVYLDEITNNLETYVLCEVNYRKTMGLVIQSLAEKYSDKDFIEWHVRTPKEIKLDEDFYKTGTMLRLSPDGTHFQSYLRYF